MKKFRSDKTFNAISDIYDEIVHLEGVKSFFELIKQQYVFINVSKARETDRTYLMLNLIDACDSLVSQALKHLNESYNTLSTSYRADYQEEQNKND